MCSQGANPICSNAACNERVPVRPNPAPITIRVGEGIPTGGTVALIRPPSGAASERNAPSRAESIVRPPLWRRAVTSASARPGRTPAAPIPRGARQGASAAKPHANDPQCRGWKTRHNALHHVGHRPSAPLHLGNTSARHPRLARTGARTIGAAPFANSRTLGEVGGFGWSATGSQLAGAAVCPET